MRRGLVSGLIGVLVAPFVAWWAGGDQAALSSVGDWLIPMGLGGVFGVNFGWIIYSHALGHVVTLGLRREHGRLAFSPEPVGRLLNTDADLEWQVPLFSIILVGVVAWASGFVGLVLVVSTGLTAYVLALRPPARSVAIAVAAVAGACIGYVINEEDPVSGACGGFLVGWLSSGVLRALVERHGGAVHVGTALMIVGVGVLAFSMPSILRYALQESADFSFVHAAIGAAGAMMVTGGWLLRQSHQSGW